MALIDKASLLMVPSTYEAGKLYNVLPSGNRAPDNKGGAGYDQTRADFDFDRGSNAAATRIGSDGLLKKYQENLLLQSNNFGTTWAVNTASVTSGQIGYDGSSDAWLLNKAGANKFLYQTTTFVGVQTISIYAKAGSLNWLNINCGGGVYGGYFDLSNGVTGSNIGTAISTKIEAVGNTGWYRCEVSGIYNSSTSFRVYPADGNNDTSGTSGNILIQSAQLETGLAATDVLTSGTTTAKSGLLIDLPRINYDANGENGALLLEPSRTNQWSYSEYVSGNHLVSSPIITENYAVSPEGLSNAFRIQDTTGGTFKRISLSSSGLSVSANSTYTQSLFVKKATSAITKYGGIGFDFTGGSTRKIAYVVFDEYNGTLVELTSSFPAITTLHPVEDYGDYWRFSVSVTDNGSNTNMSMNIYACLSGNGTSVGTGQNDWTGYGLQLEAGSYATSYIPTMGTAQTRAADTYKKLGFGNTSTEGTFFIEFEASNLKSSNGMYMYGLAVGTTDLGTSYANSSGALSIIANGAKIQAMNNGYATNLFSFTPSVGEIAKIAIRYDGTNVVGFVNGVKQTTHTDNAVGVKNSIRVNNGEQSSHATKQILFFPSSLTDAEAIALTS